MKLGYLLLTVAIVATGLFVYDTLRREPAARGTSPVVTEVARDEGRGAPARDEQPLLAGTGFEELVRRIEALEARLAASPSRTADVRVVPDASGGGTPAPETPAAVEGTSTGTPPLADPALAGIGDPKNPRIDPQTLEWFRAGMDEVDRIRDQERRVAQEKARLARVELSLTPQQEEAVIAATLQHRTREQERGRALMSRQGVTREDREALQGELRTEYVRELEKLVPAADAEKIADGMVRPRFMPNRRAERRGGEGAPGGNVR
jgi:hypothetical protein